MSHGAPLALCLLLLAGAVSAYAAPASAAPASAAPAVVVTDNGEYRDVLPQNRVQHRQEIAVSCGDFSCTLVFCTLDYLDAAGKLDRSESSVGVHFWPTPDGGQGWYPNDTFSLSADGTPLRLNGALRDTRVVEQGASALVETTLVNPKASVRLRFSYHPGQEGLDVQVALLPGPAGAPAVKQLSLDLSCYPAFFTAWNKRRGDRWVATPTRSLEEPREAGLDLKAPTWKSQSRLETLDLAQENWLFYYDKIFNSADGGGRGVCGLVFLPAQFQQGQVNVTDYEIHTRLDGKPDQRTLAFTLWQNTARDYGPQLQRFPHVADACRQRLQDPALFLPQSLVGFDNATEEHSLQALAQVAGHDKLTTQLQALEQAVARVKAAPEALDQEPAVVGQLMEYRRALWQAGRALPRPRRVLVVEGADYPEWKLDEAAAASGGNLVLDKSYFSTDYRGDRYTSFPATEADMLQYDAVVLANVSATPLRASGEALLKQFVTNGGGLLTLGGFYAYGEGAYQPSVLADLLPVTVAGPFDVKRLPAPAGLVPGTAVPGLGAPAGADRPVVLWLQTLQPKPEATTAIYADLGGGKKAPFLVVGRAGAGRVVACAGTVYGEAPAGRTEFWNAPEWPDYVTALLHWVCGQSGN